MFDDTAYYPNPFDCFPSATLIALSTEHEQTSITIAVGDRELTILSADTDIDPAVRIGDRTSILVHPTGTVSVRRVRPAPLKEGAL